MLIFRSAGQSSYHVSIHYYGRPIMALVHYYDLIVVRWSRYDVKPLHRVSVSIDGRFPIVYQPCITMLCWQCMLSGLRQCLNQDTFPTTSESNSAGSTLNCPICFTRSCSNTYAWLLCVYVLLKKSASNVWMGTRALYPTYHRSSSMLHANVLPL